MQVVYFYSNIKEEFETVLMDCLLEDLDLHLITSWWAVPGTLMEFE